MHTFFTTMTNNYARPHYEREHPHLSQWDRQALMARDFVLGRCMGLSSSGMWLPEHQLESQ